MLMRVGLGSNVGAYFAVSADLTDMSPEEAGVFGRYPGPVRRQHHRASIRG